MKHQKGKWVLLAGFMIRYVKYVAELRSLDDLFGALVGLLDDGRIGVNEFLKNLRVGARDSFKRKILLQKMNTTV